MALGGIGPNAYIKQQTNLIDAYARNPKSFPFLRWTGTIKPVGFDGVARQAGYWNKINYEHAIRVTNANEGVWPDKADRPISNTENHQHEWLAFRTVRQNVGDFVGYLTQQQAFWPVLEHTTQTLAVKLMTIAARKVIVKATTAGNWATGTTDTMTNFIGSGTIYDPAANTGSRIRKLINTAKQTIHKNTYGAFADKVQSGLRMVINPEMALNMAMSYELTDFIKQQPSSPDILRDRSFYERWGIPSRLFDCEVVVDDTVYQSTAKGTTTVAWAFPSNVVLFTMTQNGSDGQPEDGLADSDGRIGVNINNTITRFVMEELTIETDEQKLHRRTRVDVTMDFDTQITSPSTGYLVTSVS